MECVCVWFGAVWEVREGVDKRIGFCLFKPVETVGVLDVCLCCGGVGDVGDI